MILGKIKDNRGQSREAGGRGQMVEEVQLLGALGHFWRPRWQPLSGSEQRSDTIRLLSKRITLPGVLYGTERKDGQLVCSLNLLSSPSTI